ncbi:MAG: DUF1835 domain-containing protein [Capnocytophaga sp.]|nr:DUF1835 domain-containing protein [Capnocytophaga sp.]
MRKVLHITGNKNTTEMLKKMEVKSEVITWNEMLCDGKTSTDIGSEIFWKNRYNFFKNEYNTGKLSFIDSILKEYRNLCNQKTQDEVVLWFSDNLQNQINMIAVMSWLKKYRKGIQISWVKNYTDNSTHKELKINYESRIQLNQDDVEYADYIWQLYCSDSPLQLEMHIKNSQTNLTALHSALELHLKRFPSVKNGLNIIENQIITEASLFQGNKTMFLNHLVEKHSDLGYNAMQFNGVIDKLKSLFHSVNPLKINTQGESVIQNTTNMYPILRNEYEYLGGSLKYDFLYYDASNKILKL